MIRLDLISGFLGVGKTSFCNLLLRHYVKQGLRPVFIVNEFGKTGLDADIIKADGFVVLEIEGGCICCTLKDDIGKAIISVVDKFSPTNIVFEPSGIFIFDNFFDIFKQQEISKICEIGSVLTIVDGVNFSFSKTIYGSFIYNQIKNAETILLSKLEKITHDAEEIICDIKNINPNAFIMHKVWEDLSDKDFELLLNQEKGLRIDHHAHHHSNLNTFTIKIDKPFSKDKLNSFIDECKSGAFGELCRVKGIVNVEGQNILLNIAMQDAVQEKFKGMSAQTLTFIGQTVKEDEILSKIHSLA